MGFLIVKNKFKSIKQKVRYERMKLPDIVCCVRKRQSHRTERRLVTFLCSAAVRSAGTLKIACLKLWAMCLSVRVHVWRPSGQPGALVGSQVLDRRHVVGAVWTISVRLIHWSNEWAKMRNACLVDVLWCSFWGQPKFSINKWQYLDLKKCVSKSKNSSKFKLIKISLALLNGHFCDFKKMKNY